jgi:hypothetical protein
VLLTSLLLLLFQSRQLSLFLSSNEIDEGSEPRVEITTNLGSDVAFFVATLFVLESFIL